MQEFRTLAGGLTFTECPRWHDGLLYVSDFFSRRVLAVGMDGSVKTIANVAGKPAGLGFLPDGRLLIASKGDRKLLRLEPDGMLTEYADLSGLAEWDLNDMLVDHDGRAWVGSFGFDLYGGAAMQTADLICVEPDGTARIGASGLGFPNGMALTPDGGTLIVAETTKNRICAFDVVAGSLSHQRIWASFGEEPTTSDVGELLGTAEVVPDGICLDEEGAVWVADVTHNRLVRIAEGGDVLEERSTGDVSVFACMLGGEDGRTLFACVAPSFHEEEASTNHRAAILTTRVKARGAGLP